MIMPEKTKELLSRIKTIAMATVGRDGTPNVVPMARKYWYKDDLLIIGDMFMKATKKNVLDNGKVSICVWDDNTGESFKLKGIGSYETSGETIDIANEELKKDKPDKKFKGVVIFRTNEVYTATRGKNAGSLIE